MTANVLMGAANIQALMKDQEGCAPVILSSKDNATYKIQNACDRIKCVQEW
jgi:hypothetical protein